MTDISTAEQQRETYLAKAVEAEGMAAQSQERHVRLLIMQIAQSWRLIVASMGRLSD
jgi:hypothetical protein